MVKIEPQRTILRRDILKVLQVQNWPISQSTVFGLMVPSSKVRNRRTC